MSIIRKIVSTGCDIYTDGWRRYDALAVQLHDIMNKHTMIIRKSNLTLIGGKQNTTSTALLNRSRA